jgi:hypothetical protein
MGYQKAIVTYVLWKKIISYLVKITMKSTPLSISLETAERKGLYFHSVGEKRRKANSKI